MQSIGGMEMSIGLVMTIDYVDARISVVRIGVPFHQMGGDNWLCDLSGTLSITDHERDGRHQVQCEFDITGFPSDQGKSPPFGRAEKIVGRFSFDEVHQTGNVADDIVRDLEAIARRK